MKLKLVVASGVHKGREIPIAGQQFTIGRDPQCQLRPASPAISKKHCAIILRGGGIFVRDFGSTNGTFVDGKAVVGEVEIMSDQVALKVGPLDFQLVSEVTAKMKAAQAKAVAAPEAIPKSKSKDSSDDDFAAFLLEGDPGIAAPPIPDGSTVLELGAVKPGEAEKKKEEKKPEADTQSAAADILRMYRQRPRS